MKIDYKPVYIANDGTEFDSHAECAEYEESLSPSFTGWMLTHGGNPTSDYGRAYIVQFTSADDIVAFLRHSDVCNNGLECDSPIGVYVYDERSDYWYRLSPFMEEVLKNHLEQTT